MNSADLIILPSPLLKMNILLILVNMYINGNMYQNPLLALRQVCKHIARQISTTAFCMQLYNLSGFGELVLSRSDKNPLSCLKELSLIMNLEKLIKILRENNYINCGYNTTQAFANNDVNKLNCLKRSNLIDNIDSNIIDDASDRGHLEVLDWWKKSGFKLDYGIHVVNSASSNGHVEVLDWWKKFFQEINQAFPYSHIAIDMACKHGHVNSLNWWLDQYKSTDLELKYTKWTMDCACENNHIHILDWWAASGLKMMYSEDSINWAYENGHVDTLRWWIKSGLDLEYNPDVCNGANEDMDKWMGQIKSVAWYRQNRIKLVKLTKPALVIIMTICSYLNCSSLILICLFIFSCLDIFA